MNTDKPFVGIGKNPDGKDLPMGFGMRLVQSPEALNTFGNLTQAQRDSIVDYIHGCTTSQDAKERIAQVIDGLKDVHTQF